MTVLWFLPWFLTSINPSAFCLAKYWSGELSPHRGSHGFGQWPGRDLFIGKKQNKFHTSRIGHQVSCVPSHQPSHPIPSHPKFFLLEFTFMWDWKGGEQPSPSIPSLIHHHDSVLHIFSPSLLLPLQLTPLPSLYVLQPPAFSPQSSHQHKLPMMDWLADWCLEGGFNVVCSSGCVCVLSGVGQRRERELEWGSNMIPS